MQPSTLFRYQITLVDFANPPGTCDRIREELRAWITDRELGYAMGALGGSRNLYGYIGHSPPASEGDRQALIDWLRIRQMCADVQLGPVIEGKYNLMDPINGVTFSVDGLTCADRTEAGDYHANLRQRVERLS